MGKNVSLPALVGQLALIVALVVFLSTTFWNSMTGKAPDQPALPPESNAPVYIPDAPEQTSDPTTEPSTAAPEDTTGEPQSE